MEEKQAWRQLSMEMECQMPGSQDEDHDNNVFRNSESELKRTDTAYWSGKFSRTGPFPTTMDLQSGLHDVSHLQPYQAYSYDINNASEGPFPETCIPQGNFAQTIEDYKRHGTRLTGQEVKRLLDGVSVPGKNDNFASIEKVFIETVVPYLDLKRREGGFEDASSHQDLLKVQTVYDVVSHGSCLFRCIDYCLNGRYTFFPEQELSKQDCDDIVCASVNQIKRHFVSYIVSQLSAGSSEDDQKILMQKVIVGHEYDARYGAKYREMPCEQFVQEMLVHQDGGLQKSDLEYVHNKGTFIIDVASHPALFREWLHSDKPLQLASQSQIQLARSAGALGLLMPPGYMNPWTEGGEFELSLVPQLFQRQIVLLDLDAPLPQAGASLRCTETGLPVYVSFGPLAIIASTSVYAKINNTHDILKPVSQNPSNNVVDAGPMILMRRGGHYTVQSPTDKGVALLNALQTMNLYRYIALLHSERKDYLVRIFKQSKTYDASVNTDTTSILPLVSSILTDHQRLILSYMTYEKARIELAFCRSFLRLPFHSPDHQRTMVSKLSEYFTKCQFKNPVTIIKSRKQPL